MSVALLLVVVLLVGVRRLRWSVVDRRRLLRGPSIILGAGVFLLVATGSTQLPSVYGILLTAEVLVSSLAGLGMGTVALFRTARLPSGARTLESRTPWPGLVLWIAVVGLRLLVVHLIPDQTAAAAVTASLFLVFGANRLVFAVVLVWRARRII